MTKKLLFASALLLLLALDCAAQDCQRYREPDGGFSICKPDGWVLEQSEGLEYKSLSGPRRGKVIPNINFQEEAYPAGLSDYVAAANKRALDNYQKAGLSSMTLVGQTDFRTTSGTDGIRVAFKGESNGQPLRFLQYFFVGKDGKKLIITCTAPEADKDSLDPVFERAVKSLRFDR